MNKLENFSRYSRAYKYIQGVAYGDGCLRKNVLSLRVVDSDFAEEFKNQSIQLGFNPKIKFIESTKQYQVLLCSKKLCSILKTDIIRMSIPFVNGFIDSEGCVTKHRYRNNINGHIQIVNTNHGLLIVLCKFFESSGIKSKIYLKRKASTNKKQPFVLQIMDIKSIRKFHKLFRFSIKRRQERLEIIVDSVYKERRPAWNEDDLAVPESH